MSSSREHHAKAEELLELACTENDSIRRSLVLAEAQVHATLALGDPGEMSPAGPGQDQAADTKTTGAAHSGVRYGNPVRPAAPAGFSDRPSLESRPGPFPGRGQELDLPGTGLAAEPPPLGAGPPGPALDPWQWQNRQVTWPLEPARPAGRRPAPGDPDEEGPDEEGPDDTGEQKPGGPEKPEPGGGFRPF